MYLRVKPSDENANGELAKFAEPLEPWVKKRSNPSADVKVSDSKTEFGWEKDAEAAAETVGALTFGEVTTAGEVRKSQVFLIW